MTCTDIITEIDVLEPNQYDMQFKLRWLSDLDGQIYDEVIRQHLPERPHHLRRRPKFYGNPLDQEGIGPFERERRPWPQPQPPEDPEEAEETGAEDEEPAEEEEQERPERFATWGWPYVTGRETLLIREPYARDVYTPFLKAMIARENAEYVKYNAQMTLYNAAFRKWAAWYNRNHMPKGARGGNRWRY